MLARHSKIKLKILQNMRTKSKCYCVLFQVAQTPMSTLLPDFFCDACLSGNQRPHHCAVPELMFVPVPKAQAVATQLYHSCLRRAMFARIRVVVSPSVILKMNWEIRNCVAEG